MKKSQKFIAAFLIAALCSCFLPAATGAEPDFKVFEDGLTKIATYDYGQSRESLTDIENFVRDAHGSPGLLGQIEQRFDEFLKSNATLAAKQFVCRQLRLIGTEKSVPTLAGMLTAAETSDMARYALEPIPGAAVDEALRDALTKAAGKERIGIINTLGVRADSKSASALGRLLGDSDVKTAAAAAAALGRIADANAAASLAGALAKSSGELRPSAADAYLKCADRSAAKGEKDKALAIYKQIYAPTETTAIRGAALKGMITVMGDEAVGTITEVLKGKDRAMQNIVVGFVREAPGTKITKAVAAELPNLSVEQQLQLLPALGDRGDARVLPVVLAAAKSGDKSVRTAALTTIGKLGNASCVELLARTAALTSGAEQEAALASLYSLRGPDINKTILSAMEKADPNVKVVLIRSLGQRYAVESAEVLLKAAKNTNDKVRLESLKALKNVAAQKHLPELVDLLINAQSDSERTQAGQTVVAVAETIAERNRRAEAVLAVLPTVKDAAVKCSLLSVLGEIGDNSSLPAIRAALDEKDTKVKEAAIRALSEWPSPEPADDLLKVVKTSDNSVQKILALRGFVRLIGLESDRSQEDTIKLYQEAMKLASDVGEKKMVLSGLATVKSTAALDMALPYLDNEELRQETEAAVVKIADGIHESFPQQAADALQKVLAVTKNDSLRQKAEKMLEHVQKLIKDKK